MSGKAMTAGLALRDKKGTWYVLTSEILAAAQATSDQRAQLEQQGNDDTTGFSIILHDLRGSPVALKPLALPSATAPGFSVADTAGYGIIVQDFDRQVAERQSLQTNEGEATMTQDSRTERTAQSFADHMRSFHDSLPADEQALLEQVFTLAERAAGQPDDTEGYLKITDRESRVATPSFSGLFAIKPFARVDGEQRL